MVIRGSNQILKIYGMLVLPVINGEHALLQMYMSKVQREGQKKESAASRQEV
jgi:hypothetical protein